MGDKLTKYILQNERASDNSEALFILCTKRPAFKAQVHHFQSFKEMFDYKTDNITKQVHKFPILLEVVEIEDAYKENNLLYSLIKMSDWYYYSRLKP